jgi:hypothetical protein
MPHANREPTRKVPLHGDENQSVKAGNLYEINVLAADVGEC